MRVAVPLLAATAVALAPGPATLAPHAWHYFAIFLGVLLALILEPVPNAAAGVVGVAAVALLARWALFGPEDLARPGFDLPARSLEWALSGFQNPAVWLAFSAFMFALGYDRTGLGRRVALWIVRALGRSPLRLGYAAALIDLVLAPFTPSNTARSAGTVYPILRGIPRLYGSEPDHPSARLLGGYLMWTAFASSCVTSSLFLTALAPNLVAVDFVRRMTGVEIGWLRWLSASASFGVPLLLGVPWLARILYPPGLRASPEVPAWAAGELRRLGPATRKEAGFALLVAGALVAWVAGASVVHPAAVALVVIGVMLVTRISTWDEMVRNAPAWDMLFRLATLVALADGLNRVGFVHWLATGVARWLAPLSPPMALVGLVGAYFLVHYLFATTTAHVIAVLPVMLGVGLAIPGLPVGPFALLLALSHGLMGVISPYATGPAPVYGGSGYLPPATFWRLGAIFGLLFLAALLALGTPVARLLLP
jgi:L-tartrate/succinate antiporter